MRASLFALVLVLALSSVVDPTWAGQPVVYLRDVVNGYVRLVEGIRDQDHITIIPNPGDDYYRLVAPQVGRFAAAIGRALQELASQVRERALASSISNAGSRLILKIPSPTADIGVFQNFYFQVRAKAQMVESQLNALHASMPDGFDYTVLRHRLKQVLNQFASIAEAATIEGMERCHASCWNCAYMVANMQAAFIGCALRRVPHYGAPSHYQSTLVMFAAGFQGLPMSLPHGLDEAVAAFESLVDEIHRLALELRTVVR